jgi:Mrp family chromosome partitioning ATPase
MKKIVIVERQFDLAKSLITLLTDLFPECEIDIIPAILNSQDKIAKDMGNTYRAFFVDGKT